MQKKIGILVLGLLFLGTVLADAQIVIDPVTKKISITGINLNTGNSGGATGSTDAINRVSTGISPILIATGSEFERALSRIYSKGITKYNTASGFRQFDLLTREETAKMIVQTYNALGYTNTSIQTGCTFTDSKSFNPELSGYIKTVCQIGIMKGAHGKFMPTQKLTRPEAMAILVRMFEGKRSYEAKDPRWSDYYLKGKALGLTTLQNSAFDKEISRYEIALYIYRLQTISNDASLKLQAQNKVQNLGLSGDNSPSLKEKGLGDEDIGSELAQKFSAIANSISVEKDPELQEAINWMHDNGLTNFTSIGEYKPFELLLREQAAKIFDIFAKVFNFSQDKITQALPSECQFNDISKADTSLILNIENVCKMELLKGGNKLFDPKNTLTKGQFITALIRLVDGKKDENTNPRRKNYYQKALDMGIVGPADAITFDSQITRYEVALFLYRFKVKYQLVNSLNTETVENLIINTVPNSIKTGTVIGSGNTGTTLQANIFIDTNLIQNGNFEIGYIEIFGSKYKVIRTSTETYFNKNFVRYGDLYDLAKNTKVGNINFIVSNRYVIEGAIRLPTETYLIAQVPETTAYYTIKKQ